MRSPIKAKLEQSACDKAAEAARSLALLHAFVLLDWTVGALIENNLLRESIERAQALPVSEIWRACMCVCVCLTHSRPAALSSAPVFSMSWVTHVNAAPCAPFACMPVCVCVCLCLPCLLLLLWLYPHFVACVTMANTVTGRQAEGGRGGHTSAYKI